MHSCPQCTANIVAFWSGKWNAAQQNYPVHEQELLALVETLKRFRGVLHGTEFTVRTDHKALEHFMKQKNLSPRQHRWIDILSEFDFGIQYIPGDTNGFADALSRVYSDEPKGVVRAESEFVDEGEDVRTGILTRVHPVYVETYLLSLMSMAARRSNRLADKPAPRYKETRDRRPHNTEKGQADPEQDIPKETELPIEDSEPVPESTEPRPAANASPPSNGGLLEVSSNLGISFPDCIQGRYDEDEFFKPILANPEEFTNFRVDSGLVFSLGADPYLPRGLIESFLRVFKYFALKIPRGKVRVFLKKTLGVKIKKSPGDKFKKTQGANLKKAWGVFLWVFFEKTPRFLSQFDQN